MTPVKLTPHENDTADAARFRFLADTRRDDFMALMDDVWDSVSAGTEDIRAAFDRVMAAEKRT